MYGRSKTTRITWNKRVLTKTMGANLVRKYMEAKKQIICGNFVKSTNYYKIGKVNS